MQTTNVKRGSISIKNLIRCEVWIYPQIGRISELECGYKQVICQHFHIG